METKDRVVRLRALEFLRAFQNLSSETSSFFQSVDASRRFRILQFLMRCDVIGKKEEEEKGTAPSGNQTQDLKSFCSQGICSTTVLRPLAINQAWETFLKSNGHFQPQPFL